MKKQAILAGGCFWGEPVWGTGARPCQLLCDFIEQSGDKVYSSCKDRF